MLSSMGDDDDDDDDDEVGISEGGVRRVRI